MNICIVGQYPPMVGGVATYSGNLKRELEKEGHNVYVLTYWQEESIDDDHVYMAGRLNIPFLRAFSFLVEGFFVLKRIVREYDIDIIHANYLLPPGLLAVSNKKRARIIITAHGSDINILSTKAFLKPLLKFVTNNADDVYFVAKELREKALENNIITKDTKTFITPNTVDTEKFKPTKHTPNTPPVITFIGNLVKQKGLQYLLEAKKQAKTDYTLKIYGDGPEKNKLQQYIKENNIKNTFLKGKTTKPEKRIQETDIMVLPSIHEGASIITLESMASGKALISTDTGNIKEVITDHVNGIIVEKANPQQLSQAIDELVNNKTLRTKLGENARKKIIKDYSKMKIPYTDEVN